MPIITYILIGLTAIISMNGFNDPSKIYPYTFSPYLITQKKDYKRILTHLFIHGNWSHLIFNMLTFYFVGSSMELTLKFAYGEIVGSIHFILIYFLGALVSGIWPFIRHKNDPSYESLGASGAIAALMFAFVMWYPDQTIYIFFAIPMKAFLFGPLYLVFEYYSFRKNKGNIAHDAHIGGAVLGIIYILVLNFEKGKEFINVICS